MTFDSLRTQIEHLALQLKDLHVRAAYLEFAELLLVLLERQHLDIVELRQVVTAQADRIQFIIADSLLQYSAGETIRLAASEASMRAELHDLRAALDGIAVRLPDVDALRSEMARNHAALLAELARVRGWARTQPEIDP